MYLIVMITHKGYFFKMKIALCATHLFNMTLPQDRDYIGVDHGVEELLKQE